MTPSFGDRRATCKRMIPGFVCLILGLSLPACPSTTTWLQGGRNLGPPPPPNASKSQLIGHINNNIMRLYAWRSTDVEIRARGGLPVKLSAVIAVESPRNFRLRVSSMAGDEADLGSNDERFWFWMRRGEPKHVFTAGHDQLAQVQHRLQIPFQPDWLMEVLGVIPIDESQFTLEHHDARSGTVSLVSDQLSPEGRPVRRVILVDAQRGVVVGHSLYDGTGQLIAKAMLKDHRMHSSSQIVLPHRIELDWPQTGLAMTMSIGNDVEVNPAGMSEQTWQMPELPDYPPFDLGG